MSLLAGCDGNADSYCEALSYSAGPIILSIPRAHFAAPRDADGALSLMLRYRDLAAPKSLADGYDPQELADPSWSLDRSNTTTLLQIQRDGIAPPDTMAALQELYPDIKAVGSDWQPWRKFKECPIGCEHAFYLNEDWSDQGLRYIACEEVENRNPFLITCTAFDTIEGLDVTFQFPAAGKQHFPDFRERIIAFLHARIAEGQAHCR